MGLLDELFSSLGGGDAPQNPILAADTPEAALNALAASRKEDVWRDRIAPTIQAISYSLMTSPSGQPFANMAAGWQLARETMAEDRARQSQQLFNGVVNDISKNAPSPFGLSGGGSSPAARPPGAASPSSAPSAQAGSADERSDVASLKSALAPMESGGRYDITGPVHRTMGTPLGKYQVMSANLPAWSQAALGREVSPAEFLKNPALQEQIAGHRMGQILDQYGNLQDAASVWHSGRPLAQAIKAGARDVNMSTADYVAKTVGRQADMPARGARPASFDAMSSFTGGSDGFFVPPAPQNPILAGLGGDPNLPAPDTPGPLSSDLRPAPPRRPAGLEQLAAITGGARPGAPARPADVQGPPQPLSVPNSPPTPAPGGFGTPLLQNPVLTPPMMTRTMQPGDPAPLPPSRPADIANPILVPQPPPAQASRSSQAASPVTPAAARAVDTALSRAAPALSGPGWQTVALEDDLGRTTYSTVPTGVDRLSGQGRLASPSALSRLPETAAYASLSNAGGLNRIPATGTVVDDAGRLVAPSPSQTGSIVDQYDRQIEQARAAGDTARVADLTGLRDIAARQGGTPAGNGGAVQVAQASGRAGTPAPSGFGSPQPITPQAQNGAAPAPASGTPAGTYGPKPPSENEGASTQRARAMQIASYWNTKQIQAMALGGEQGKALATYAQRQLELYATPYLSPTEHERALAAAGIDPRSAQGRALQLNAFPDSRPASTREYEFYADQETRAGRQPKSFEEFSTSQRRAGATNIDVGQKLQTEFDKGSDATMIKRFSGLVDEGDKAGEDLATVRQLRKTYGAIDTKSLPSARAWLAERGIKIGDDIGAVEAYSALIDRMVPAQRIPGAGTTSDRDLATFKSSLPNLMRTPEGNAMIMDTLEGLSQHRIRRAEVSERALLREISPSEAVKQLRELPDPFAAFKASQDKGGGDRRPEGGAGARSASPPDTGAAAPFPPSSGASRSVERIDQIPEGAVYKTENGNVYRRENGRSIFLRKDKP